jgi:putative transposon-encoded protein
VIFDTFGYDGDTENVSLKEKIEDYFKKVVLPHAQDAWID